MRKLTIYTVAVVLLLGAAEAAQGQVPVPQQADAEGAAQAEENKPKTPWEQYAVDLQTVKSKVPHKTARQRRVATRGGNMHLKHNSFSNAVTHYREALKADSLYSKAQYNVALAHSKLGQNDSALAYYRRAIENPASLPATRAKAYYNSGNIYLNHALAVRDTGGYDHQGLQAAIGNYQAALRLDSQNQQAKYNLSIARQLLRPEPSGQGGGGGQNQQKQDQQDQQQQDQQNQQNQSQDQQQQQQQQGDQQEQQQEQQQKAQSHREAEQMLNALKNNEQQTMKKVQEQNARREKRKGLGGRPEKDW